jgi:hypothetical protein
MIHVIDDRLPRQSQLLNKKVDNSLIRIYSSDEVARFQIQLEEGNLEICQPAKIVIAHQSSLFDDDIKQRDKFKKSFGEHIIFFSGRHSSSTTTETGKRYIFVTSPTIIYDRIQNSNYGQNTDPREFLYGKGYRMNTLNLLLDYAMIYKSGMHEFDSFLNNIVLAEYESDFPSFEEAMDYDSLIAMIQYERNIISK